LERSFLIPFLRHNLDLLFVGLNPARGSSENRHYFSVNQSFWNQLFAAGLITGAVDKAEADTAVFGGTKLNYRNWQYGITDLITEIAESDSKLILPTQEDCARLERVICTYAPKAVVLLHNKVVDYFLPYLGYRVKPGFYGQLGVLLPDCTQTMFFRIAFPHGNIIPTREKVKQYRSVLTYLNSTGV
jgi:hypothetical protein